MKKILIFSLAYYPHFPSGAEGSMKEITGRITDIEFHMVTLRYRADLPKVEKLGNVLVHRIGITVKKQITRDDLGRWPLDLNKPLYQFLAAWKALRLHRTYKYDGTWALMAHSAGVPAALFNFFHPEVPMALTLQEGDPPDQIERTMRPLWPLFARAFTRATVVQAISKFLAAWARRMGYKGDIELIKNGANPNDLKEAFSQEQIDETKKQLGKKDGEIYLVNTSRLVHQKGFDTAIDALTHLPANIKLLAVGGGEDEAKLKEQTKRLGLEDRVLFTGQVERSVVTLYRKASDIFVAPSRSEGLGNAFISALASRLPLITTGVGGIADYAVDGQTAWIVPPNDPKAIADKVLEILANPQKAKEISDRARRMVEEEYDWDKIARQMRTKVFAKII
jgi:glycosyltransferase involved in cell wall biosynthesis